jgi:glycosyltransferase involved in cell wall biosynthesis
MLDPWSFEHKRYKKALPWLLWEKQVVRSATVIEVKSRREAHNVMSRGFRNPLAVIPIGLDGYPSAPFKQPLASNRTCLFLSRIHPVKGVENLINAWAVLHPCGWSLVIAGPDGGAYQRSLEQLVAARGLTDSVRFVGPAFGDSKWSLMQSADLFVLPSFSENFGVVVTEALSQGVPVITTNATPWDELADRKCGWQVQPTCDGIQTALSDAFSLSPEELRQMGENGRNYVDACFRWDVIIRDTLDLYTWACDGGPPPRSLVNGSRMTALAG